MLRPFIVKMSVLGYFPLYILLLKKKLANLVSMSHKMKTKNLHTKNKVNLINYLFNKIEVIN